MKAAPSRRDRLRAMLADLKMPGSLEALDPILQGVDGGAVTAAEATENLLGARLTSATRRSPHGSESAAVITQNCVTQICVTESSRPRRAQGERRPASNRSNGRGATRVLPTPTL